MNTLMKNYEVGILTTYTHILNELKKKIVLSVEQRSTKLRIPRTVFFLLSMKIDTHELKWIHSIWIIIQLIILLSKIFEHTQGLKTALVQRPRLQFLTLGQASFITRKARRTSAYRINPPINCTNIDEIMTFLRKSKFPMTNIATCIIITITNQNRFLLWSDVFIF